MDDNDREVLESRKTAANLYKAALGDIDQLVSRLESVQGNLTGAADQVSEQLKPRLDELYAAIGRLQAVSKGLIAEHTAVLEGVATASADALNQRARTLSTQLHEQMGESAKLAVSAALKGDVVKKPVEEAVEMVRGAISDLSVKTANVKIAQERMIADTIKLRDELSTEISNAKKLVAGTIWYQIGAQIGVAVLVGVVMVAAARWAGFGGMSDEQFSQVRADVMKASSVPHYK